VLCSFSVSFFHSFFIFICDFEDCLLASGDWVFIGNMCNVFEHVSVFGPPWWVGFQWEFCPFTAFFLFYFLPFLFHCFLSVRDRGERDHRYLFCSIPGLGCEGWGGGVVT